jgi:hypothetical protein
MSLRATGRGAYRIKPSAEAWEPWARLSLVERELIERQLGEVAWMVSLRQWVSTEETEESFELLAGGHTVSYRLEPRERTLQVTGLKRAK